MPDRLDIDDASVAVLSDALKLGEFFPSMSAADFGKTFPRSGLLSFAEKEYVLHQGEAGRDVFVVLDGLVTITQMGEGGGSKLGTLEKGAVFGEIALAKNGTRTATAIATRASRIFQLAFPDIQGLANDNPKLGEHLKALAEKRLQDN
jgi:CRP-like cAMP-binding protein